MKSKHLVFQLLLLVLMVVAGVYFYNQLPETIAVHRNVQGIADNFEEKNLISVFMLPLIASGVLLSMKVAPSFDPRKRKYEQFLSSYEILQTLIVAFFAYMYGIALAMNLNPNFHMLGFVLFGFGIFLMLMGNYLSKVRRNYFIGIRTPWTLENEEVWNKTQRVAGLLFFLAGFSCLINAFFRVGVLVHFVVIIALIGVFPLLYYYFLYRKVLKK